MVFSVSLLHEHVTSSAPLSSVEAKHAPVYWVRIVLKYVKERLIHLDVHGEANVPADGKSNPPLVFV